MEEYQCINLSLLFYHPVFLLQFSYLFPFILLGLVILHILVLHDVKSNNPLGIASIDNIQFTPYYIRALESFF